MTGSIPNESGPVGHWDHVWSDRPVDSVSWYQREPVMSLRLLGVAAGPGSSAVDVGAGASPLVDRLLDRGWTDLTVLDLAAPALAVLRQRLGARADAVTFIASDVLDWRPERSFDVWHDRAVLHFLTDPDHQQRYAALAAATVAPGGALVLGVFAADGPTQCSGLPTAHFDAATLARLFAPEFRLEREEREEHRTPAGDRQAFTWVVLRRR